MTSGPKQTVYVPIVERRVSRYSIRGIDYAVNQWGDAANPTLFFLHGWGDCGATFQFVVDALERDYHVVAPDWRGFGDSGWNASGYWFPDYLADLAVLLDEFEADRGALIVAHSMGANVAGLFAGAFPERVRAFVNLEGFGLADSDPADAPGRYRQWIESGASGPQYAAYQNFDELAQRVGKRAPRITDARAAFVARAWGREDGVRVVLRADPAHKRPNPVLYRRAEAEACWRSVTAEVLLVAGEHSEFAAPSDARLGPGVHALPFPSANVETLAGAGHMLHFEVPEALAAVLDRFFAPYL